jgi:sugar phosphate isomerase/epimerase
MKAICADRPFRLTLHGPLTGNFGDHEHVEAHRDAARAGLEAAAEIGAEVLVWHAAIARGVDLERSLASEREALHALAPAAEAARCRLCVETMYCKEGERTAAPSELAEHFASLESEWIGAVVDFSHSSLNCADRGLDLLTELEALAPYARHLHLHDSFARPRQFRTWSRGCDLTFGFGDLHLPPGDGALPWEALARLPWRAPMIANLELNQHWRAEWPEAIAWTRRWIDQARAGALGH